MSENKSKYLLVLVVTILFIVGIGLGLTVNVNPIQGLGTTTTTTTLVSSTTLFSTSTVTTTTTVTAIKSCEPSEKTSGGGSFQAYLTGVGIQDIGGCTYTWISFLHPEGYRISLIVRGVSINYRVGYLYNVAYMNLPDGTHTIESIEMQSK